MKIIFILGEKIEIYSFKKSHYHIRLNATIYKYMQRLLKEKHI